MSFCSTIYGNLPDSGFVYTATTVSVENGSFENLSAVNASITNLHTTTFNPINVDCTTLTATDAIITNITATNATIDDLTVTNFVIDTLNATTGNISTLNTSISNSIDSNISNINCCSLVATGTIDAFSVEATQMTATSNLATPFVNTTDIDTESIDIKRSTGGRAVLDIAGDKLNIDGGFLDAASVTAKGITLRAGNAAVAAIEVEDDNSVTIRNLSSINYETDNFSCVVADITTLNTSQINVSNISTRNLSAVLEISSTFIKATNRITAPVMNTQLNNVSIINASTINSQIGNFSTTNIINNNVSSVFVKRSTGGKATLDIAGDKLDIDGGFSDAGSVTARGITLRAGNEAVAAIEIEDDNSVTIRNLSSVNFETDNLTADLANATTSNISTLNVSILNASTKNSQTMNASTINCSTINSSFCNAFSMDTSIITSKIYQLEDATGGGGADGVISESSNVLTIRTGAAGGVTKFGTTSGGNFSVQIAGDALNASTINSSQINATDIDCTTIDADTITGDIGGNLAAGTGISLSTVAGVTTITNSGSVTDPLNLSKLNVSNISGNNLSMTSASISGTIESAISKSTIFEVLDSGGGSGPDGFIYETANVMSLVTGAVGGVIRFGTTYGGNFSVNISGDALNVSKINASNMSVQSITSNNIYTPGMKAQYQNVSFLYYDDVQGVSNPGIIYKAANKFQFWSGTGTTKLVFTNDNSNLSVEVANNQLNASVANISTGTIKTLISTTGTIGQCNIGLINSSNINGDFLNGNIANNLAAGTNITLSTTGGVTTINSTGGGVTDPLNLSTLNASIGNIAMFNSSMLTSDFINGTTANISTVNTSTTNGTTVNASTVNASTVNGNIANNLLGGTNITLSTAGGVTTINGPIRSVFGVTRVGVFTPATSVTDVRFPYNSTKITNSNYSWSGLVLTIATAGTYLVSATCGLISSTYADRVCGRIRTLTNGTWDGSADAESFCYLRHDDFGEFESMAICQLPRVFAAGDTLEIQIQVGKASQGGPGSSNFDGLVMAPGSNLTVEKVA